VSMVEARLSAVKSTRPQEFALRFLFGGLCTVAAGLVAKYFGPVVGGLFLAFPAIFPAGASLIESHERKRKAKAGLDGTIRGRVAAGVDAAGTSIGCVALAGFAGVLWVGLGRHGAGVVQATACAAWVILAGSLWLARKGRLLRAVRSLLGAPRPDAMRAFKRSSQESEEK
jgi:hypothetical protein